MASDDVGAFTDRIETPVAAPDTLAAVCDTSICAHRDGISVPHIGHNVVASGISQLHEVQVKLGFLKKAFAPHFLPLYTT